MTETSVIGLDLAKNVFQVFGVNHRGKRTLSRKVSRKQLLPYFARIPSCVVGMEACSNSYYWARELMSLGHEVKLMNPKFVKPYVKGNKNDYNDAEAICEAVQRPNMRFVDLKTPEQQAVSHLHQSRQLLIKERVSLSNHIRALLSEFGLVFAKGVRVFEESVPVLLADETNGLPAISRRSLGVMWSAYQQHQRMIAALENELAHWHAENEASCRLAEVPSIGLQTATALTAKLGNGQGFQNGREVAAFIGLVSVSAVMVICGASWYKVRNR